MSTEIKVKKLGDGEYVHFTRFYGGKGRGICLQITPWPEPYAQLTLRQAREMGKFLIKFADNPMEKKDE